MADPFSWLAGLGAAGGTGAAAGTGLAAGAAGSLAPLGAASSAAAAATTAAGITAGTITPTVIASGGGLGAAAVTAAKEIGKTIAGAGVASLLAPRPKIPAAPKAPTVDDARQRVEEADRLRAKKGGAAAILTSPLGVPGKPTTATKTLLGQ